MNNIKNIYQLCDLENSILDILNNNDRVNIKLFINKLGNKYDYRNIRKCIWDMIYNNGIYFKKNSNIIMFRNKSKIHAK
jgi:hypothetical protein